MAIDQTEAMIAAIKAQLEKERAAEAAKQKRLEEEQALKNMSSNKKKTSDSGSKSQYKTLSAEELARIEEKKRRKREEALGIVHEDKPEETENKEAEAEKPDTNKEAEGEAKTEEKNEKQEMPKISLNLGGIADEGLGGGLGEGPGGLGSLGGGLGEGPSGLGGLGGGLGEGPSGLGGLGGGLGSAPSGEGLSGKPGASGNGLGSTLNMNASLEPNKVKGKDKTTLSDDAERFDEDDMSSVVSDDAEWTQVRMLR